MKILIFRIQTWKTNFNFNFIFRFYFKASIWRMIIIIQLLTQTEGRHARTYLSWNVLSAHDSKLQSVVAYYSVQRKFVLLNLIYCITTATAKRQLHCPSVVPVALPSIQQSFPMKDINIFSRFHLQIIQVSIWPDTLSTRIDPRTNTFFVKPAPQDNFLAKLPHRSQRFEGDFAILANLWSNFIILMHLTLLAAMFIFF